MHEQRMSAPFEDPTRLKIELAKADALRLFRPYLSSDSGGSRRFGLGARKCERKREEAIRKYLATIIHAYLRSLLDSEVLPPDVDIEAFANSALKDAKNTANSSTGDRVADENRASLLDICRVGDREELNRRRRDWEAFPVHGVVDYDPTEEEKIRAEWEAVRAKRLGSTIHSSVTDPGDCLCSMVTGK